MIGRLGKRLSPYSLLPKYHAHSFRSSVDITPAICTSVLLQRPLIRRLANIKDDKLESGSWFSGTFPRASTDPPGVPERDVRPPDERTLKLGKTVQILHDRLPTLLSHPLPQDILSPQISLHLFPSTHPFLPTVSGRIAYSAALWTAPVAWGRVPVVGNIRLVILSERMVKRGTSKYSSESLIVRWRTCGKTKGRGMGAFYRGIGGGGDQVDKITEFLGGDVRDDEEFTGLFIFDFDEEGRILQHVIEHAQQSGNWGRHTRVVSVTDWLLGLARRGKQEADPGYALGYCEADDHEPHQRLHERRRSNERN